MMTDMRVALIARNRTARSRFRQGVAPKMGDGGAIRASLGRVWRRMSTG